MNDELTMTDGQRLLRRILECPGDDAVRLIYSDWLEEQGEEERAEFIRNQIKYYPQARKWLSTKDHPEITYEFDRGFVSSVSLTCEAFVGQECTACNGTGHPHKDGHQMLAFCGICGGTGRIEGVARELFSRHPIVDVKLVDKNPHPPGYSLGWRRNFIGPDSVPEEIYDLINGWRRIHSGPPIQWKEYFTTNEANAALSRACVSYGRNLVGLPLLP